MKICDTIAEIYVHTILYKLVIIIMRVNSCFFFYQNLFRSEIEKKWWR